MAITRYSQVAFEQVPFANYPGGGMTNQGSGGGPFNAYAGFNDPGIEIGNMREITAIYQMYGNEAASDVINLYLAQPGTKVSPVGWVSQSGIATTATINIGDDDTTGSGLVSNPTQNAAITDGASATRYCSGLNVATGQTGALAFTGGDALYNPYIIGATATEGSTGPTGTGVSGAWVYARFVTLGTPVAGKVLVFRLRVIKP